MCREGLYFAPHSLGASDGNRAGCGLSAAVWEDALFSSDFAHQQAWLELRTVYAETATVATQDECLPHVSQRGREHISSTGFKWQTYNKSAVGR
ncbi:hypothetical protein V5799_020817 [Amblyomma americanum]|uniref:Uncharacterized protein n=1 Tax=Amblyomma americanum TaxID=6943 RepID=A0AAQ4ET15_AMBAM